MIISLDCIQVLKRYLLVFFCSIGSIFAYSGFAIRVNYNELATFVFLILVFFELFATISKNTKFPYIILIYGIILLSYATYTYLCYACVSQITNYVTIFLAPAFVYIFGTIRWQQYGYSFMGVALSSISVVCILLLVPGMPLSGWNPNSSICVLPSLMLGSGLLVLSGGKNNIRINIIFQVCALFLILRLENRSSFLSLAIFNLILLSKLYLKRSFCVLLSAGTLLLNVALPVFQTVLTKFSLFETISNTLYQMFGKSALNGREKIWPLAMNYISANPIFGTVESRNIYFHNLSIDIMLFAGSFGLFLWITYMFFIVLRAAKSNESSNIFLVAFALTIFLNTFENVYIVNNYFTPLPYALLALPLYLKRRNLSYEKR